MTRKWSGASGGCFYPLRFQEGSLWDYSLFRGTERVDTFSVAPEYWEGPEDVPDDQLRRWRGDAQKLAALWQLPVERIDRYIVQWGLYDIDEDTLDCRLKGKAYPADRSNYGNPDQIDEWECILDRLRATGPVHRHIHLFVPPHRAR